MERISFAALILAVLILPHAVHSQATGADYRLLIDCPDTQLSIGATQRIGCPVRAIDPSQQQILGEPALAIDPFDSSRLIFAALHGAVGNGGAGFSCGDPPGPTPRSRCILPFTTFTSTNGGASWYDNFYPAPDDLGDAYGEHPALTIDPYGRLYVGSLYATWVRDGVYDYTIVAQKFSDLQTINDEQDGQYQAEYLGPVYPGNAIGQLWFLFNPATDNMTMVWHEHVTPQSQPPTRATASTCAASPPPPTASSSTSSSPSSTSSSSATSSSSTASSTSTSTSSPTTTSSSSASTTYTVSPTSRLVALPQLERAPPPVVQQQSAGDEPRSVIGVAWTEPDSGACYRYQPHAWSIGPCERSTNPVLSEGWLYIGCVSKPDEGSGFPWNPDTIAGTVELFRMHPDGGQPHYLGPSSIHGGMPKLGVRSDGRLALATAYALEGQVRLDIAFGAYDPDTQRIRWSSRDALGSELGKLEPGALVVGANIQDLIFREHSGVVHAILKERIQPRLGVTDPAATVSPQLRKHVVAIDETYGLLAKLSLDIGNLANRTNPMFWQVPEDAFDDLSDDFLQYPTVAEYRYREPGGVEHILHNYQREFFAVADYGEVLFAEVIELTNLRGPAFPAVQAGVPPNPSPATTTATTTATVSAAGLTLVGALALTLMATKRKEAVIARQRPKRPGERLGPGGFL